MGKKATKYIIILLLVPLLVSLVIAIATDDKGFNYSSSSGYDGVDISNYVYPSLSYVRQPFEKLADTIVDVLLRKINGENLTDDVVVNDVRFIKGNTTR